MEALTVYLLKMLVCSAILFGYYRVALYNERFHQWNRFYLLAAMLLSVIVPFISIPILTEEKPEKIVVILSTMPWNAPGIYVQQSDLSWKAVLIVVMVLVSVILLFRIIVNISKLVITYKTNPVESLNNRVQLILTKLNNAPFSFFNWLFWRHDIDPASDNGQRMLKHELTHIREHHSFDKIFTELLLCIFWMNPFFWLMRRELSMIHEFLADSKAINQKDGAAFAAMILQSLHLQPAATNGLVNPFFSSQIKRRLLMITTSKEPSYSYLRRLSGLALMVCSAGILTLSIQQAQAQEKEKLTEKRSNKNISADKIIEVRETKSKSITKAGEVITLEADSIFWNNNKSEVIAITSSGEKVKIEIGSDNKGKVIIDNNETLSLFSNKKGMVSDENRPLYMLDGEEITPEEMAAIDAGSISKVDVIKDGSAVEIYGEKGRNGVVLITSKGDLDETTATKNSQVKIRVTADEAKTGIQGIQAQKVSVIKITDKKYKALIYADDKEITQEEMNNLDPASIEAVSVLKGASAIEKYGDKGKDGVIELTMKTNQTHDKVFTRVEQPAQFPGGDIAWKRYFEKNVRYPDAAQKAGTEGIARIQFRVDEQGLISNVKALNDPGNGIGEEAMRLIKQGPKWQPAVQNGRQVVYQVEMSIPFKQKEYY